MSIIAKMYVASVAVFGTGQAVTLSCVCENDLMAAYAGSEEDKLFTKYSPWGELVVNQPAGYSLGVLEDGKPRPNFYLMVMSEDEAGAPSGDRFDPFMGAYTWADAVLYSLTKFAGDQIRIEFRDRGGEGNKGRGIDKLSWKMSVDNPAVTEQLEPGRRYFIGFYPADSFNRDSAIAAAHRRPVAAGPEPEAADEASA